MPNVTTIDNAKLLCGVTGTSHDTLLGELLNGVTAAFEAYLQRPIWTTARTEEYDIAPRQRSFSLRAFPLASQASIASVKNRSALTTAWADITAMDTDGNYWVDLPTGILRFRNSLYSGPSQLQVVYTAGMGADQTELETNYPDVVSAADLQLTHIFQKRTGLGSETHSIQGSSVTSPAVGLLPLVKTMLGPHVRPSVAV